ncbi:hypothetical protein NS365_11020 [Aureimonas ureilytica]|uniref:Response regulatory domain-containing protein n=1 Tax=Aureimonas ureilytica TaxID=401562 RepID=A0A175RP22_9HYPH|nr:fused response regulator/phosphatase [Aureimonas ureilytica]KTR05535.1 hypothetical protein NS365_11020 [Aureimonas ureilytica]
MTLPPSRVLVVDDVAENRDLLLRRLRRMQLTDTAEAANGREALEFIRREPFDLVLLDVMMPEMSGIEVLRALREDGRLTDLPVVMISAASEIEKVVECVELGAEDYLPKPFNPALLAARVRAALERRHLRMENRRQLERLTLELEKARRLQIGMMPDHVAFDPARWDIAGRMEPALEIGGDLYDLFEPLPGTLCVAIGDVAGKGMPAGLFMARARSLLRAGVLQHVALKGALPRPSEIAGLLNDELCKNNPDTTFVTLFVGLLTLGTGEIEFCNAGHVYPLRVEPTGRVEEIVTPADPALGVVEDFPFADHRATIRPGETWLLSTDGLGDTQNPDGEALEIERVLKLVSAVAGQGVGAALDQLTAAARTFADGAPPFDDVTLVALRRLA